MSSKKGFLSQTSFYENKLNTLFEGGENVMAVKIRLRKEWVLTKLLSTE